MNEYNLKYYGNSSLSKNSVNIEQVTQDIKKTASEMIRVMHENDGVGLAAPQIGLNLNLIVINLSTDYIQNNTPASPGEALLMPQMPITLINPEVSSFDEETSTMEEGCLSIPEIYAPVTRPASITLKARLLNGSKIDIVCSGFLARVVQHEIDHLKGILFTDRLEKGDFKKVSKKLDKLQKRLLKKRR